MRRILAMLSFLTLAASTAQAGTVLENIVNRGEWRGFRFGASPSKEMVPLARGDEKHVIPGEPLEFDGLRFTEISYWAFDNRVTRFEFKTVDPATAKTVALMLKKQFRDPPLVLEGRYFFENPQLNVMVTPDRTTGETSILFELK